MDFLLDNTHLNWKLLYGVAFYLTPQEVTDVAQVLQPLPLEVVAQNYDAAKFCEARVYLVYERWDDEGLKRYGIDSDYENLRTFFTSAANDSQAMVLATG